MKEIIKQIPILGDVAKRIYWKLLAHRRIPEPFPGSAAYWEKRYSAGEHRHPVGSPHFRSPRHELSPMTYIRELCSGSFSTAC